MSEVSGAAGSHDFDDGDVDRAARPEVAALRVRDGDVPDGDRVPAAGEVDIDGELVRPVAELRACRAVPVLERRGVLGRAPDAVDREVDASRPASRARRRATARARRSSSSAASVEVTSIGAGAGAGGSAGCCSVSVAAIAAASWLCRSGACGRKVAGDDPSTCACVTALISGAAQLERAANACGAAASAAVATSTRSDGRLTDSKLARFGFRALVK